MFYYIYSWLFIFSPKSQFPSKIDNFKRIQWAFGIIYVEILTKQIHCITKIMEKIRFLQNSMILIIFQISLSFIYSTWSCIILSHKF